ncbi:hypothetical protein ACKFKG_07445 [Phormidesmis sp. 146-35]
MGRIILMLVHGTIGTGIGRSSAIAVLLLIPALLNQGMNCPKAGGTQCSSLNGFVQLISSWHCSN